MTLIVALILIVLIAAVAAAVRRFTRLAVCPICVGVSGTWLLLLVGTYAGYPVDPLVIGILMGGSVVGVAYQLEKRLRENMSPALWKLLFIPPGFAAVESTLQNRWLLLIALLVYLASLTAIFTKRNKNPSSDTKTNDLVKKMQSCC